MNKLKIVLILASIWAVGAVMYRLGADAGREEVKEIYRERERMVKVTPSIQQEPTAMTIVQEINPGKLTWHEVQRKIDLPGVFTLDTKDGDMKEGVVFSELGTYEDGSKLINAEVSRIGMGIYKKIFHLIRTNNGIVYLNLWEIDEWEMQSRGILEELYSGVRLTDVPIVGLIVPEKIITQKGNYVPTGYFGNEILYFSELKNPVKVDDSGYGRIYATYEPYDKTSELLDRRLWLRLKDDTVRAYKVSFGFVTDDNLPKLTWADGSTNIQIFGAGMKGGCGMRFGDVIRNEKVAGRIVLAGKTQTGEDVFKITDRDDSVLKSVYKVLSEEKRPNYETWFEGNGHFLVIDGLGEWNLFISEQYMIEAECAKPVIYLYPKERTDFSLRVGAEVTVSEPEYSLQGWSGTAYPDGKLVVDGEEYPYLFWEGTGKGVYTDLRDQGVIVESGQVGEVLTEQLTQMNLNEIEIADFLEFWLTKMPETKYVRLTWLQTQEMNKLAPLEGNIRIDSMIRVFLEFEGLEQSKPIGPQKLVFTPRDGSTLVEWGGLLVK